MSAEIDIYNPEALGAPMGQYTHVTRVKASEFLFIAGMLSGDNKGNIMAKAISTPRRCRCFVTSRRR